jgi:hypothetical protein
MPKMLRDSGASTSSPLPIDGSFINNLERSN